MNDWPKCTNGHDRCYEGPSDDCPYCEKAPTFIREDTKRLRELTPKLTPEQEAANEQEHNIRRGEHPKW